jgi:hypothetical protein
LFQKKKVGGPNATYTFPSVVLNFIRALDGREIKGEVRPVSFINDITSILCC